MHVPVAAAAEPRLGGAEARWAGDRYRCPLDARRTRRVDPDRVARGWLRGHPRPRPVPDARGARRSGLGASRTRHSSNAPSEGSTRVCAAAIRARSTSCTRQRRRAAGHAPRHLPSAKGRIPRPADIVRTQWTTAGPDMTRPTPAAWVMLEVSRGAHGPARSAQPARMSVLILPARGLDTRFVIPCDSSAVQATWRTSVCTDALDRVPASHSGFAAKIDSHGWHHLHAQPTPVSSAGLWMTCGTSRAASRASTGRTPTGGRSSDPGPDRRGLGTDAD